MDGNARRRGWNTVEDDIPSSSFSYEMTRLNPQITYKFRVVAVYSNNDNKHGPNSARFKLAGDGRSMSHAPTSSPVIVVVESPSPNSLHIR